MERDKNIIPCLNMAHEAIQPIRLRYKIVNSELLTLKVNTIKCIEYRPDDEGLIYWKFTDEVLQMEHGMTMPPPTGDFWLLGKLEITNTEVLVMVNSVQRALFALTFFDIHFGRGAMLVQSMDICNELYKNNQENTNLYNPIQRFFKGKQFVKGAPLQPLKRAVEGKQLSERQMTANNKYVIDKIKYQISVPYENKEVAFYKLGLEGVTRALHLHQNFSKIHLEHGKDISLFNFLTVVLKGV